MDVAKVGRADDDLDRLIERRSRQKTEANELAEMWAQSERKYREKLRRENRAEWYIHYCHLQDLHAALSEEHRVRAEALLEEPGGGGLT